jgi:hypothetical protein
MENKHPKVSGKGKQNNIMKNAALRHSKKHEVKKDQEVDLLPPDKRKA